MDKHTQTFLQQVALDMVEAIRAGEISEANKANMLEYMQRRCVRNRALVRDEVVNAIARKIWQER